MLVLIINHFYPPVVNAHAYRWEQIARHWVSQGHQVEVITSRVQGSANHSVEAGVSVTRVGIIARPIKQLSDRPANQGRAETLQRKFINMLRPLYRKIYWPDAWWHWTPFALLAALRRRHTKYDLIVSYYPCMGAHFTAAMLKRWPTFSTATWIADYGDPFSTSASMPPNNFFLFDRLNKRTERSIARLADFLVFTNQSTAETYTETVAVADKIRVIPHLVDLATLYGGSESARAIKQANVRGGWQFELLYIGGFHRGIREPDLLFDLVRLLNKQAHNKIYLRIFGPENGFNLSPVDCPEIIYEGMLEREKAIALMRIADILVNVENRNCVMIPSKVVEYIGTGRPILNIKDEGRQHPALERYINRGHGISISKQDITNRDLNRISDFIQKKANSVVSLQEVKDMLKDCTIENVADSYRALISHPF